MKPEIKDLIEISSFYGSNKEYVIAGGGNTSFKDDELIWIKASGYPLANIIEDQVVVLRRDKLHQISLKQYSDDAGIREEQVKNDLFESCVRSESVLRPSVETSLHELIRYRFIVHLHPTLVNGLLCSLNARSEVLKLFGDEVLFVPYTDPGYTLFKKLEAELYLYRQEHVNDPSIIFLENHGVFVGAETISEIKTIYDEMMQVIRGKIQPLPSMEDLPYKPILHHVLPAIRMILSDISGKVIRYRHNSLVAHYYGSQRDFNRISLPFIPDIIVYCKARFIFIEQVSSPENILDSFRKQLERFIKEYGYTPKIIVIKDLGVFAFEDSYKSAETALDVYEDLMKISWYAQYFGGPKFLSPEQISFIDQWEVEKFRRKIARGASGTSKVENKVAIVTGGAQGFGAGIAEELFALKTNVVIGDLNENSGKALADRLNATSSSNHAVFVKTDVSDPDSVRNLVAEAVREFGGLDIMISNAGILKAGGLDEMEPEFFSKMTQVNYFGYFYCARFASEVMRLQNLNKPGYFTDIIQINSKSGLQGSERNFAYAGSKFGGIGLTQSFAMELASSCIKVNSICPGNFYEGPLWSDPHNGLFVQYLSTGKVPGAKTIEDVKKYYEEKVPMKRGCQVADVMKAIIYLIDQEYETGQAIPVTGGQIMLG